MDYLSFVYFVFEPFEQAISHSGALCCYSREVVTGFKHAAATAGSGCSVGL